MKPEFDAYFLKKEEPIRGCLLALKKFILDFNDQITPEWKYGMPAFYFKSKPLCYLWTDKKTGEPYVLFVDGIQIQHPNLEQGSRAKMKVLTVSSDQDLPVAVLTEIFTAAISIQYQKQG